MAGPSYKEGYNEGYEEGRREGSACVSCKGAHAVTCSACNGKLEDALLAQGRREGYAECQRDVVAWLKVNDPNDMDYLASLIARGEHVGMAKGGAK